MKVILYRAMCQDEKEKLEQKGFFAMFSKGRHKWFATDPKYIYIIVNEFDYGLCPDIKYTSIVRFEFEFDDAIPNHLFKFKTERGYLNVAFDGRVFPWIRRVEWKFIDKKDLPKVEPVLVWKSRSGRIVRVFSIRKARKLLQYFSHRGRSRILYMGCM